MTRSSCLVLWLMLSGCTEGTPSLLAAPTPPQLHLREANVLLRPVPGGEELLGREVRPTEPGGVRIAPELAPGCRVEISRRATAAHERNHVRVRSYATLGADYAKLIQVGFDASSIEAVELDVQQSAVLTASLAGPCGARVITTVYVGLGEQTFYGRAQDASHASAGIKGFGAEAKAGGEHRIGDSIRWDTPSAYAFEERNFDPSAQLILRAALPSTLTEGQLLQVSFSASRPAYLIVFGVDGAGNRELLWPSNEEPAPLASAEQPAIMPSQAERDAGYLYRLRLPEGTTQSTRESLVVYGLAEKGDFDLVHPQVLGAGPDYEQQLRERLARIPMSRWSRYQFQYTVAPEPRP